MYPTPPAIINLPGAERTRSSAVHF